MLSYLLRPNAQRRGCSGYGTCAALVYPDAYIRTRGRGLSSARQCGPTLSCYSCPWLPDGTSPSTLGTIPSTLGTTPEVGPRGNRECPRGSAGGSRATQKPPTGEGGPIMQSCPLHPDEPLHPQAGGRGGGGPPVTASGGPQGRRGRGPRACTCDGPGRVSGWPARPAGPTPTPTGRSPHPPSHSAGTGRRQPRRAQDCCGRGTPAGHWLGSDPAPEQLRAGCGRLD